MLTFRIVPNVQNNNINYKKKQSNKSNFNSIIQKNLLGRKNISQNTPPFVKLF
jgi:hypothetical protein